MIGTVIGLIAGPVGADASYGATLLDAMPRRQPEILEPDSSEASIQALMAHQGTINGAIGGPDHGTYDELGLFDARGPPSAALIQRRRA